MTDTESKNIVPTSDKLVKSESAISFLNDLHHIQKTESGDIAFRVPKTRTVHLHSENSATKYIHSVILFARSKWFKKAYKEFLKHKDETKFELNDFIQKVYRDGNKLCFDLKHTDLQIFREFEQFLYAGRCTINDQNLHDLINIAGAFGVLSFESIVTAYLSPILDKDLITQRFLLEYLLLFSKYNYSSLKEKCVDIAASKRFYITETKLWKELFETNPSLVTDLMLKLK